MRNNNVIQRMVLFTPNPVCLSLALAFFSAISSRCVSANVILLLLYKRPYDCNKVATYAIKYNRCHTDEYTTSYAKSIFYGVFAVR